MDRIIPRLVWARIRFRWTPTSGIQLAWRVGNEIAGAAAGVALEGVEEVEPVADFVHGCVA